MPRCCPVFCATALFERWETCLAQSLCRNDRLGCPAFYSRGKAATPGYQVLLHLGFQTGQDCETSFTPSHDPARLPAIKRLILYKLVLVLERTHFYNSNQAEKRFTFTILHVSYI